MEWKTDADWQASIDENLRMGYTELMILHLVSHRPMYGYELRSAISRGTNGAFAFGDSTLYVPLLRMASRGLILPQRVTTVGKRFRTYYHITELGKRYLAYGMAQWRLTSAGLQSFFGSSIAEDCSDACQESIS